MTRQEAINKAYNAAAAEPSGWPNSHRLEVLERVLAEHGYVIVPRARPHTAPAQGE